jgi:DNA replication protein DnaC
MSSTNTISQVLDRVQTSIKAQPTTARQVNTPKWENASGFQTLNDPTLTEMLHSVANWMLDMDDKQKPRWVSLVGKSGTGKTMLAKWAYRALQRSKHWVTRVDDEGDTTFAGMFVSWPELADQLQANGGRDWMNEMKRCRILVLDDVGQSVDKTGFITGKLSILLSARVGKWTFITSNLSVGQIAERIDTRIASRLIRDGNVVVDIDAKDWALRK